MFLTARGSNTPGVVEYAPFPQYCIRHALSARLPHPLTVYLIPSTRDELIAERKAAARSLPGVAGVPAARIDEIWAELGDDYFLRCRPEEIAAPMADYHEELAKAGVLVDGNGLKPTSKGWRLRYTGGKLMLIDGPFTETKEIVAGYTIIKVASVD